MSPASVGRGSALMALGTITSRILGFVKAILLAAAIGVTSSGAADAFGLANQLPNNVYVLILGGALNAILVPQLIRAGVHTDSQDGRVYLNRLLTIALVLLGGVTLLATIAAPVLVMVYGGASAHLSGDTLALAVAFAYWCLPQIFFYGLYTLLGEVLNARSYFGPFMWAPVVNNVVAIAGLLVFISVFGLQTSPVGWSAPMILLLAGSATLGVALQALILLVFWRRTGLGYRPDFHWRGVGLGSVGKAASWTFAMLVVMQLGGILSTQVLMTASGVGASVAAQQNAWLVFMLPHSIVAVSVVTVYFTRMSTHVGKGDRVALRADLASAIRIVGLVNMIAIAVLMVLAFSFSRVFVEGDLQVQQLAEVVLAYMPGLIAFGLLYIVQRAFFALEDTRTPFLLTAGYVMLYCGGVLLVLLLPLDLRGVGVAAVTSITGAVHAVVATLVLRRRIGGFGLRSILLGHLRYLLAALLAAAAGLGMLWLLGGLSIDGFASAGRGQALVAMAVVGPLMLAVYAVGLLVLRTPELATALGAVRARFGRGR